MSLIGSTLLDGMVFRISWIAVWLFTTSPIIIIAGAFFGDYIDSQQQSTTRVYTITFSLISVFLSLYYVIKEILKHNEKK